MGDNPFAEPGDPDRTIIRPMPGGVRTTTPPPAPVAPPLEVLSVPTGDGPLANAAAPLLTLLARLSQAATPPNPATLREHVLDSLQAFERAARDASVPADQIRQTHYALCAALDDAVLNTPWGAQSAWSADTLARSIHQDADAGRGFFNQLRTLRDTLPASRPVIEIMFLCLALGMMGPYRQAADGPAQIERARHHVFEMIAGAAPVSSTTLAPPARGITLPPPARARVPVWVAAAAALATIAGFYVWQLTSLNARSDEVYRAALAIPPSTMPDLVRPAATPPPAPPPAPPPGLDAQLRAALPSVEIIVTPSTVTLRLSSDVLFPAPNASLAPASILDQVSAALVSTTGAIHILAYADNQPTRSVGFPSSFALTTARARAIQTALARTLPAARLTANGRADADPIAPNTTPDGRTRNRRIDLVMPNRT